MIPLRWLLLVASSFCLGACTDRSAGELVVYSAGPRPLIEQLTADFTAESGIPVRLFVATTGQLMAKLEAERFRPRADVVIFASPVAAEALKSQGRLASLRGLVDPQTDSPWHDPDGYYLATSAAAVGVALAGDFSRQRPDWEDFFGGGFPGRAALPSPSRSGTAGDFVVSRVLERGEAAWGEFAQARASGLEFPAANSQALGGLLIGSYQAVIGAADYLVYRQIEQGADIAMHYPASGVPLVTRPVALLAQSQRRAEGRRFAEFLLQTPAQRRIAAAHLIPLRGDVAPSAERAAAGEIPARLLDVQRALAEQGRILRRFQYRVERSQ